MPLTSYSCYSYDPKECSNDTIIYIPHGRDNISHTQDISHTYYMYTYMYMSLLTSII